MKDEETALLIEGKHVVEKERKPWSGATMNVLLSGIVIFLLFLLFLGFSSAVTTSSNRDSSGSTSSSTTSRGDEENQYCAHCGAFGSGSQQISKNTWAVSDPIAAANWMLENLPTEAFMIGSYDNILNSDDGKFSGDECGTFGKVFLNSKSDGAFQLHAVNTATSSRLGIRPTGSLTLAEIEGNVSAAISRGFESHGLVPFMDWNVGLWTSDLEAFATHFATNGIPVINFRWPTALSYFKETSAVYSDYGAGTSDDGTNVADSLDIVQSLICHVPNTTMVFEIMGPPFDASAPMASLPRISATLPPVDFVDETEDDEAKLPTMKAMKVSYASTDIERDAEFYASALGAIEILSVSSSNEDESSSKSQFSRSQHRRAFWFENDNANSVEVHVVQYDDDGSDDDGGGGSGDNEWWSVAAFEAYVGRVHAANMGASHLVGSDALLDNHFGRRLGNSGTTLDATTTRLDARGDAYRLWKQTNDNTELPSVGHFVYAAAPAGNAVQIVGNFNSTPSGIEEWSSCLV